jgi:hypothetical protein
MTKMETEMNIRMHLLTLGCLFTAACLSAATTVHVTPTDSLNSLRERLANDANVREVVFEEGTYWGGLYVEGPKDTDLSQHPLLIRAADGAKVVFDGARPVERFQPHEELPGVFWINYTTGGGEYPKLWEPNTRMRYRLVADHQTVARFPATYTVEGNRLLFHTSDGQAPGVGDLLMSAHDCGMFIRRPHVTVRGIAFQGNDVLVIHEDLGQQQKLRTFDCDYNNYGTALRPQPEGTAFDSITPRREEPYFRGGSKAIVNYSEYRGEMKRFVSMAQWREFSGLDRHTIYADPLYVNSAARDFRIDPNSPNRGAGPGGVTLGAMTE